MLSFFFLHRGFPVSTKPNVCIPSERRPQLLLSTSLPINHWQPYHSTLSNVK
jgi:hypothetical protein